MKESDGTFWVEARRCKRCGGLLTSKKAVQDGYGHICKIKASKDAKPDLNQIDLFGTYEDVNKK